MTWKSGSDELDHETKMNGDFETEQIDDAHMSSTGKERRCSHIEGSAGMMLVMAAAGRDVRVLPGDY